MTTDEARAALVRHAEGFDADDPIHVYRIAKVKAEPDDLAEIEQAARILGLAS